MAVSDRLTQVFEKSEKIAFDDTSRFVIFSDCHRGDNSWSDEFANNQNTYFHALTQYYNQGFTYIEAGDGEELWENSRFEDIRAAHDNVYWLLSEYHKNSRLIFIWGNHNRRWSNERAVQKDLYRFYDERQRMMKELFKDIKVHEGVILHHVEKELEILVAHGHQGDLLNDGLWWVGRFFVRNLWKILQEFGFRDPTRPAKNYKRRKFLEEEIVAWTQQNRRPIIVGHTHRPRFPEEAPMYYFNAGSCVHPRSITAIEIVDGTIALIKWFIDVRSDESGTLFINKEVLEGPINLNFLIKGN